MNYGIFDGIKDGSFGHLEHENEQEYMERVMKDVLSGGEKTDILAMNDRLAPQFLSCDANQPMLTLGFKAREWMLNPHRQLHGGMIATCMDMAMGLLSRYCFQTSNVVTSSLNINFMRTVDFEDEYAVTAVAEKAGRRVVFLSARVTKKSNGKLLAMATGTFMTAS